MEVSSQQAEFPTTETARGRTVSGLSATLLLGLAGVATLGGSLHPLLAASLGTGILFCWVGWPSYCETLSR